MHRYSTTPAAVTKTLLIKSKHEVELVPFSTPLTVCRLYPASSASTKIKKDFLEGTNRSLYFYDSNII